MAKLLGLVFDLNLRRGLRLNVKLTSSYWEGTFGGIGNNLSVVHNYPFLFDVMRLF